MAGTPVSSSYQIIYNTLSQQYGPQHWWPGETPFEVMVGAILTQNTVWSNVERAIIQLKQKAMLDPKVINHVAHDDLAQTIRSAGYFNIKAQRLKHFCHWYLMEGGFDVLKSWPLGRLRKALLSVNGVGPETADDILLYAFNRRIFVIDAYTRRLIARIGLLDTAVVDAMNYEHLRHHVEAAVMSEWSLSSSSDEQVLVNIFNEYHALIVIHCKDICKKRPQCQHCCLAEQCDYALLTTKTGQ